MRYPVAIDNDFRTWRAYDQRYWPAHYLIDRTGRGPPGPLRRGRVRRDGGAHPPAPRRARRTRRSDPRRRRVAHAGAASRAPRPRPPRPTRSRPRPTSATTGRRPTRTPTSPATRRTPTRLRPRSSPTWSPSTARGAGVRADHRRVSRPASGCATRRPRCSSSWVGPAPSTPPSAGSPPRTVQVSGAPTLYQIVDGPPQAGHARPDVHPRRLRLRLHLRLSRRRSRTWTAGTNPAGDAHATNAGRGSRRLPSTPHRDLTGSHDMSPLTRRTAITMAVALLAVGGLTGCNNNKPATTPSPTPRLDDERPRFDDERRARRRIR